MSAGQVVLTMRIVDGCTYAIAKFADGADNPRIRFYEQVILLANVSLDAETIRLEPDTYEVRQDLRVVTRQFKQSYTDLFEQFQDDIDDLSPRVQAWLEAVRVELDACMEDVANRDELWVDECATEDELWADEGATEDELWAEVVELDRLVAEMKE